MSHRSTHTTIGALLLAALQLVPNSTARTGSFEDPQIVDPAGDAAAPDLYTGDRSETSFDLLAGWIDYDNTTDRLGFHMHIADTTDWPKSGDDSLWCRHSIHVAVGDEESGLLSVGWKKDPGNAPPYGYAYFIREGSTSEAPIPTTNTTEFRRPGNLSIAIERPAVAALGESFGYTQSACQLGGPVVAKQTGITVSGADLANTTLDLALADLHPIDRPDDAEGLPRARSSAGIEEEDSAQSPDVGVLLMLFAIGVAGLATRLRRA